MATFDRRFRPYRHVEHYYGDRVRELFVATAVVSLVCIPLWGDLLPFGTFVQILAPLVLVLLAGLTNPFGTMIHVYDAIVAALGTILVEYTAVELYHVQSVELFAAREVAALLLLFAFYWSVKTARAKAQGKLLLND